MKGSEVLKQGQSCGHLPTGAPDRRYGLPCQRRYRDCNTHCGGKRNARGWKSPQARNKERSDTCKAGKQQPPILSRFAGEASLDRDGNVYFTHHFFRNGEMLEADIYVAGTAR